VENSDQAMCISKVSSVPNEVKHVLDATSVRNISDFDRVEHYVDFTNQGLVIVVSYSHDSYMYDGVTNASKCVVVSSLSRSCASRVAESSLSCDEFDVSDLKFQDEATYQNNVIHICFSHSPVG
jgi:hypothetical protein